MQSTLTNDEREELEELRRYKNAHSSLAVTRAFTRLEQLMDSPCYDPMIGIRAFRVIFDCLISLRDKIEQGETKNV